MGFNTLNSLISNNSKQVSCLRVSWRRDRAPFLCATGQLGTAPCASCPLQTSHAITLQKTMEYITKLQQERMQMQEEARRLREEIEELNTTIM